MHQRDSDIMNNQNINPEASNQDHESPAPKNGNLNKTGLDEWNDRLDNNLEPEGEADVQADDNAEDFQDEADDKVRPE
ncbi:MAG: hypothetical protein EOO89_07245 [Pedobacter sp.]|nr:MAG: hypothetical protein EOO89_07245 [Pedobacter sp.]